MRRLVGSGLICVFLLVLSALVGLGCGSDVCSNDAQCGDKICYRGKCSDPSVLDAGTNTEKPASQEPTPDAAPTDKPVQPETAPKETPVTEKGPEKPVTPEPTPEAQPKTGMRKEGEPCDPRREGHARDLCGSGLECAELAQTSPSSGAPQPSGICLKACSKDNPTCPTGTKCTQTLDTKTRQVTGLYVCAQEVGEGESCVGATTCKDGLRCIRFGTTGTFWLCQKDCTQNASVCGQGEVCKAAETNEKTEVKICKPVVSKGQACGVYNDCDDKTSCVSLGNSIYSSTCQAKCSTTSNTCAPNTEACARLSNNTSACFEKVKNGEQCSNGGRICADATSYCAVVSPGFYSVCRKRCSTDRDCAPDEGCDRTRGSTTRVCQPRIVSGNLQLGATVCAADGRAIGFGGTNAVCLTSCSNGTSTAPEKCGSLTPGTLRGVVVGSSAAWAVGEEGLLATSSDGGAQWTRFSPPVQTHFTGMTASGDGKILLTVGIEGTILRSEDAGQSWSVVSRPDANNPNLWGVAITWDGKVALAVGTKGTIWRSEDGGKTWNPVTLTPAFTDDLHAVAFGRDKTGTTSVAVIVGAQGKLLRSEDGGKTWTTITVTDVKDALWGVSLVRDAGTGFSGVVVGNKGIVLESVDDGKTWKKIDVKRTANQCSTDKDCGGKQTCASGACKCSQDSDCGTGLLCLNDICQGETLRAVAIAGTQAWAVGDTGTTLTRDQAGTWTYTKAPFPQSYYAIAVNGSKAIMVGSQGTALYSADAGKTWKATATKLLYCIGISSNGRPSGGVCAYRCNTNNNGKDCPPHLQNCRTFTISGQRVGICTNSTTVDGFRKAGEACSISSFSPLELRCDANHSCVRVATNDYRCLESCDITAPKCSGGQKCVYSVALGRAFCGQTVPKGGSCDWSNKKFCEDGTICRNNPLTDTWTCEQTKVAKLYEHCYPGYVACETGLVCTGDTNIPYRQFCTKTCDPDKQNSCDPGFECLRTNSGSGLCIEQCNAVDYQCKVPGLHCRKAFANGNHCF